MQDSTIKNIISKIEEIGIANEPGSILYSGNETVCKGDIYFMGANPGGHSDQFSNKIDDTILNQLKRKNTHASFNEYFDARWQKSNSMPTSPGQALLQKRIKFLFQNLFLNLRKTLSTNLVFVRSSTIEKFHLDWNEAAEKCWEIHEILISEVKPKIIFVFGDNARIFLENKMTIHEQDIFEVTSIKEIKYFYYRKGSMEINGVSREYILLSTPHLSRFKINARGLDFGDKYDARPAIEWLKEKMNIDCFKGEAYE